MSINVTVHGNPISIQKGKMVTASPNHSKKEFEKRRLIRISQVREQSKSIAEGVRNRVKKQKIKQIEDIEKEGQKKLKQWQAKKLLELQNQCHEALKNIGAAHKEASLLEDEEELLLEKKKIDDEAAKRRGEIAIREFQNEKEKAEQDASEVILKKKSVRVIEDRRAQMISNSRQSSESLQKKSLDKLSNNTGVSGAVVEYNDIHETENKTGKTGTSDIENSNENISSKMSRTGSNAEKTATNGEIIEGSDDQLLNELREQKDTRISDRIRQRSSHQLLQPDVCDTLTDSREKDVTESHKNAMFSSIQQNIYACSCSRHSPIQTPSPCCEAAKRTPLSRKPPVSDINKIKCFDTTDDDDSYRKNIKETRKSSTTQKSNSKVASFTPKKRVPIKEIPTRPKVTLKSVRSPIKLTAESKSNTSLRKKSSSHSRFLASHVERIDSESLIISPKPQNNDEFLEKMRQRDREAMERGQKALEKERLQRDYNEMMKKLPILKKLERLNEMNRDKPEYHMTEERLKEKERRKQSILDNTYEKLFADRQPIPVTIPVKNNLKASVADKEEIVINEDSPSLNLAVLESERKSQKLYTEEEVLTMLCDGKIPSESKFKTEQLKYILEKLRKQKEEILKEIQNQNLVDVSPFLTNTKVASKNSETSTSSNKNVTDSKDKKFVSVKIGTDSLTSSSSYDTIDEPVTNAKTTVHPTKSKSKSVQVAVTSKKTKSPIKKKASNRMAKNQSVRGEVASLGSDVNLKESVKSNKEQQEKSKTIQKKPKVDCFQKKSNRIDVDKSKRKADRDPPVTPPVPTNSLASLNNEQSNKMHNQMKSCECNDVTKKSGELCEIVIKIKDRKSSEVRIKDKKSTVVENPKKSDIINAPMMDQRVNEVKAALKDDCCSSKPDSWHQKFCKNNSQISTSSTSYMSPPPPLSNKPVGKSIKTSYIATNPHQRNQEKISSQSKFPLQNSSMGEVQKLLAMSRQSVDDLGVSSVSSVTTPSQSIIDLESNRIIASSSAEKTPRSKVNQNQGPSFSPSISFLTVSSENRTVVTSEIDCNEPYPNILSKYARIADQCSQRISDLTLMIEKVREDKNKMLQTSLPNNDSSTKYMELPISEKSNHSKDSSREQRSLSSSSGDSKVLDINFSLAERLKGMTTEEIRNLTKEANVINIVDYDNEEEDLLKRLKALKETPLSNKNGSEGENLELNASLPKSSNTGKTVDFVPLLLDIPKVPALVAETSNNKHKKPPPSKSFLAARKYTDFVAPHELSTIPEQDSQLRLESTLRDKSPQKKEMVKINPTPKQTPTSENKEKSTSNSRTDTSKGKLDKVQTNEKIFKSRVMGLTSSPITNLSMNSSERKDSFSNADNSLGSSSDEKVEMLRIEAMLRSIGMEWAISTLRKTHEALALTSSSSSIDLKSPATLKNLSDADIREYLSNQIFQKISSSTLKTDASPGSLNESKDFSYINHLDFANKRTSTPLNRSRDRSKNNEQSSYLPSALESDKMSNDFFSLSENSP